MAIQINIQKLAKIAIKTSGEMPSSELELDNADELIHPRQPLAYDLEIEKVHNGILAQGRIRISLDCECGRCLKPYNYDIIINDWVCLVPLEGEERAVPVNDCVDLTPYIREDIILAFPQRPLCRPDCQGLTDIQKKFLNQDGRDRTTDPSSSPWSDLDKLKL